MSFVKYDSLKKVLFVEGSKAPKSTSGAILFDRTLEETFTKMKHEIMNVFMLFLNARQDA
jgi:hypothetical protein